MNQEAEIKEVASEIVDIFWRHFHPEIQAAFERKIIDMAKKAWAWRWKNEETLSQLIEKEIDELIKTEFKPLLDQIAREKALTKIQRRANRNGVQLQFTEINQPN